MKMVFTLIFSRILSTKLLRNIFVGHFWNGTEKREEKDTEDKPVSHDAICSIEMSFTCGRTRLRIVELNFLRCSGRRKASLVGFCIPGSSEILDA